MSVGPWQIVLIALVVLVLFGASRLGDIGKGLGEGIRNFKKGIAGEDEEEEPSKEPKEPKQLTAGSGSKSSSKSKQEENS
ncbi:MAG: twin-arginine translocase TatA/TatE family subunit [Polyangiaceae bacterium]